MTEDEARTKWCPFARCVTGVRNTGGIAVTYPQAAINRVSTISEMEPAVGAYCMASSCMAWRWQWQAGDWSKTHGHCGLAGGSP